MVVGVVLVLSTTAVAQSNKELRARALFEGGAKRYKAGDLEGALELWREAYQTLPRAKILLNVARLEQKLGHAVAAANGFAAYLKRDDADPGAVDAVRSELAKLDATVARLSIDAQGAGDVFVDGRKVGRGPDTIVVRVKPGARMIRLATGVPVRLDAKRGALTPTILPPLSYTHDDRIVASPLPSTGPSDQAAHPIYKRAWLYTGLVAAGATTAGIVFGLQSKSAVDDVNRYNSDSTTHDYSVVKPLVDRAQSRATLANISYVAAGVTGALTLYLLLTSSDSNSSQTAAALAPTRGGAMAAYRVSF